MSTIQSVFLGIVQGVTEFLPVSSSGHLVVFQKLMGLDDVPLLFDIILHGATIAAVVVFFRKDLAGLIITALRPARWRTSDEARLILFIIIGTIPTGIIGIAGKKLFEQAFQSTLLTGSMFLVTAGILYAAAKVRSEGRGLRDTALWTAVLIGCAQGAAILPGISRSGATIGCALLLGMERGLAFRFSFLLAIPSVAGAFILEWMDCTGGGIPLSWWAGCAVAFGAGIAALYLFWKIVVRRKIGYFAYYCMAIGAAVLAVSIAKS